MVVKMMKWRPWPPLQQSKKFEAKITLHHLGGLVSSPQLQDSSRFSVEIKWKGSKRIGLSSLRKSVRRNFTKEELLREDGFVQWDEEFRCVCNISAYKEGFFHAWEVQFTVFNGLKQGTNNNVPVVGTASLNLAEFASASASEKSRREINIPLRGSTDSSTSLYLSITLLELRNAEEPSEPTPRPILLFPRSPCYGEVEKEEITTPKGRSPRRVNIFKGLSALKAKRAGQEEEQEGSSDTEFNYSLRTDSVSELDEGDSDEVVKGTKSFDYGSLAYANHAGESTQSSTGSSEDEDWIYYRHKKSEGENSIYRVDTKRRLLPWRKRKLSFRSPQVKGEPLLKKYYGEEGGDDIDFDRRQLSSSSDESSTLRQQKTKENSAANHPFGDDNFAVGTWEQKEITSRDSQLKLKTQVFFASIDQISERAAGESACTALVAVIAHWLQSNGHETPIKSQLDTLIREGSLEWRNLCDNETYKERFPDKHFDLETVVEAEIRPIHLVPDKSFIGFFHPKGLEQEKGFDFLQGAMSFDNIWDEIVRCGSNDPSIYIISWNDHFFVLKVENDAYYIIDTLGERLYEGCDQAFILKFDKDTVIQKPSDEDEGNGVSASDDDDDGKECTVVCMGKESCKEYIKSFLAAIPIRELEDDVKKGLMASSTQLHQRLQIEFHYTKCVLDPVKECLVGEAIHNIEVNLESEKL